MAKDNSIVPVSRRKFLLANGAAASVALSGCLGGGDDGSGDGSSGDGSSGDGSSGDGSSGDGSSDGGTTESTSDSVELEFLLSIGGDSAELAEEMASEFSQQSDTASVNVVTGGDYFDNWTQTLQGVRAGDPPSMVHMNAIHALPAAANDAVVPVGELLGDRLNDIDFLDPALNYYRIDGETIGVPFGMSTISLMYNVDAFEEAGLATAPSDAPTMTFDQVRDTSEALVSEGATPKAISWPVHSWWTEAWFAMDNQAYFNNTNGRDAPATEINLDTRTAEEIYTWHQDLHQDDLYLNAGFHGWGDARSAFLNEEVAIHLDSSAAIRAMKQGGSDAGFDVEAGMVPSVRPNERNGLVIGGGALAVPRELDDDEQEAAADFLAYIAQGEQQARWHKGTGYYPVTQGAVSQLESEGFWEEEPGFRLAFDHLLDGKDTAAVAGGMSLTHGEIRQTLDDAAVGRVFSSDADPATEFLDDIKSDLDEVLQRGAEQDPRSN